MQPDVLELLRRPLVPNLVRAKQGTKRTEYDDMQIDQPQKKILKPLHSNEPLTGHGLISRFGPSLSPGSYATTSSHVIHAAPVTHGRTNTNASNLDQHPYERSVIKNTRTPINAPNRYFNSDAMGNVRTKTEVRHNIRTFELKPELMVVEAAVQLRQVNTLSAQATYAVWFAAGNKMNSSGIVPIEIPRSNEPAQVYTAALALKILHSHHDNSPTLLPSHISTIVIRLQGPYVRNAMDGVIRKWQYNGWVNGKNKPIANMGLFKELLAVRLFLLLLQNLLSNNIPGVPAL